MHSVYGQSPNRQHRTLIDLRLRQGQIETVITKLIERRLIHPDANRLVTIFAADNEISRSRFPSRTERDDMMEGK